MSATADYVPFAAKVNVLLAEQAAEMQTRGILFDTDFEPSVLLRVGDEGPSGEVGADAAERALRAMLRFVLGTVPDGCQVYFAIARPATPVSELGVGVLTLRWQVAGTRRGEAEAGVTPLHPRLGDAQAQIVGQDARSVRHAFEAAGWRLSLEAVRGGEEIWLRAEVK
ncbi:MAG: hypothetical protein AB8G23_03490 [Myxococcota bacterium]